MFGGNALLFLINILFDAYLGALVLRVLLQLTRADFYNPLSQLVWKLTNPPVQPLRAIIPKTGKLDSAALVVLFAVAVLDIALVSQLFGGGLPLLTTLGLALFKCFTITIQLYIFSLIVQCALSWFAQGGISPSARIIFSLNEPLLAPVRRFLPSVSGFDFSPLVVILALQVLLRLF